jgi:tetratricopeptide (TPR) repeat protein
MTHDKFSPETLDAAASAADLEQGVGAPAAPLDAAGVASLALNASGAAPAVTEALTGFLHEQQELARRQRIVADRQSALLERRIERAGLEQEHIEAQNRHLHMQHIHDRMRLVLDVGLAALGVALLVGIAWTLYGAITDRSLVVNAFTVAPKIESAGVSGSTVAAQFLDELIRLRESARADVGKRAVIDSVAEQVQIEIPEVHVSFGELRRLLHEALGHRTEIRGELTEISDGLALTLRGTNVPARTFTGKPEQLPALVMQASEYVYGHTDPVQMAYYLHRAGRPEETIALIRSRFASVPPEAQAMLLNVWGNTLSTLDRLPEAFAKYRAAIALNPSFLYPYENLITFQAMAGREEDALAAGQELERVTRRGRWFGTPYVDKDLVDLDALRFDLPDTIREARIDYDASGGYGTTGFAAGAIIATYYGLQHDPAAAELFLETNPDAAGEQGSYLGLSSLIESAMARGIVAFDLGHYSEAAQDWDEWARRLAGASPKDLPYRNRYPRQGCWRPIVYEMAGRRADADAAIAVTQALTNVDCYRFRADVYDHRGDWAQAEQTFAAAVARAPSLPDAYFSWGHALLGHQQYAAAIEKLEAAHQRGPRWADPLVSWGEALAAQGQFKQASEKYAEASRYAPAWGALRLRWGEALEKLGDHARAAQQYRAARDLALSDPDQQTVARYLSSAVP